VGRLFVFAATITLGHAAVFAHHAISAVYDSTRQVTLEGLVAEFHLINPHPYLIIDVTNGTGAPEQWRGELDNRSELAEIGVTASTFKPGDRVVVKGSASRTQPRSLYVLRLDRATDGFWYEQAGQSPRIRRPR
jgi:hypothetical protein